MPVVQASDKAVPLARYDSFIGAQLGKVQRRIRLLDTVAAFLVFLSQVLAYTLLMVPIDRRLDLSSAWRWLALFTLVLAVGSYLTIYLLVPLCRRLNPYFAARKMEALIPGAKNSLVNWLDLKDRALPSAIHENVVVRAARDVGRAQIDQAVEGKHLLWLGGLTLALLLGTGVEVVVLGPGQFVNHLVRVFAPFSGVSSIESTRITILEPEDGNTTVTMDEDRPLLFRVRVDGRVPQRNRPDALKLVYRFRTDEPYQEQLLERESDREWTTVLSSSQLHAGGLWYRITGGDARTDEYRVEVRARPLAELTCVTYYNRPYLRPLVRTEEQPSSLEGIRGTMVTLEAKANRPVESAELILDIAGGRQTIAAKVNAANPEKFVFDFFLDQDGSQHVQRGSAQIRFVTKEGETAHNQPKFDVIVQRDEVPTAELTVPAKEPELQLPANGILSLEGKAADDHGIKNLTLRMSIIAGPDSGRSLQAVPYRPNLPLAFKDGTCPKSLDYKDFVDLGEVKAENGQPLKLRPGDRIECRLEVTDNCDYPEPTSGQVGLSEPRFVTITPAERNQRKIEQERDRAEDEKQKHDQKQDQQLKKEEKENSDAAKKDQEKNDGKGSGSGKTDDGKGSGSGSGEKAPGSGSGSGSGSASGQPGDKPGEGSGSDGKGSGGADGARSQEIEKDINDKKGESKTGNSDHAGDGKGSGESAPPNAGDAKGASGRQGQPPGNAGKDKGDDKQNGPDPAAAKDEGKGSAGQKAGDTKGSGSGSGQPDGQPGQSRNAGQPENAPTKGESKDKGSGDSPPGAGDSKGSGSAPQDDFNKKAATKGSGADDRQTKGEGRSDSGGQGGGKGSGTGDPSGGGKGGGGGGAGAADSKGSGSGESDLPRAANKGDPAHADPNKINDITIGGARGGKGSGSAADPGESHDKPSNPADSAAGKPSSDPAGSGAEKGEGKGAGTTAGSGSVDPTAKDGRPAFVKGRGKGQPGDAVGLGGNSDAGSPPRSSGSGEGDVSDTRPGTRPDARNKAAGDLQLDIMKERLKEILRDPTLTDEERKKYRKDLADLNSIIARRQREHGTADADITAPTIGDTISGDLTDAPGSKSSAKQGTRGRPPLHAIFGQNADDYLKDLAKIREKQEKK